MRQMSSNYFGIAAWPDQADNPGVHAVATASGTPCQPRPAKKVASGGAACNMTKSWPPWCFIVGGCIAVLVLVAGYMALGAPGAYAGPAVQQLATHAMSSRLFHVRGRSNGSYTQLKSTCPCLCADLQAIVKQCPLAGKTWPMVSPQPALVAKHVTTCLDFLAQNSSQYLDTADNKANGTSCSSSEGLVMHTFWAGDGMNWKLKTMIQSFLFTHYTEDTSCRPKPVLNIWIQQTRLDKCTLTQWAAQYDAAYFLCSDQLRFLQWPDSAWLDWLPESMLTSAGCANISTTAVRAAVLKGALSGSRVGYSDAVRFLLLYKHGGIYVDADTLLLRSMEPLRGLEFMYEWGSSNSTNTAVFGSYPHSSFVATLIQKALKAGLKCNLQAGTVGFDSWAFAAAFHPANVLQRAPEDFAAQVTVLSSLLFDPIWLVHESAHWNSHTITRIHVTRGFSDFFTNASHVVGPRIPAETFHGAFTHHWHNNWDRPLVESSLMGQLVNTYNGFLKGKQPSLYGLMGPICRGQ